MKCRELIEILEELAPVSLACDWDNPGLLAGRSDKEVRTVYLALDVNTIFFGCLPSERRSR